MREKNKNHQTIIDHPKRGSIELAESAMGFRKRQVSNGAGYAERSHDKATTSNFIMTLYEGNRGEDKLLRHRKKVQESETHTHISKK